MHTCTCTRTHTHMHTHRLMHKHTHTHTHLHIPPQQVAQYEHIHLVNDVVEYPILVPGSEQPAVLAVGPLWKLLAQLGVINTQHLSGSVNILQAKGTETHTYMMYIDWFNRNVTWTCTNIQRAANENRLFLSTMIEASQKFVHIQYVLVIVRLLQSWLVVYTHNTTNSVDNTILDSHLEQ